MIGIRRLATNVKVNQLVQRRRFGGHGHDDHHHHHALFELPFKKGTVISSVLFTVFGGSGLILFACWLQNWKHGFTAPKDE